MVGIVLEELTGVRRGRELQRLDRSRVARPGEPECLGRGGGEQRGVDPHRRGAEPHALAVGHDVEVGGVLAVRVQHRPQRGEDHGQTGSGVDLPGPEQLAQRVAADAPAAAPDQDLEREPGLLRLPLGRRGPVGRPGTPRTGPAPGSSPGRSRWSDDLQRTGRAVGVVAHAHGPERRGEPGARRSGSAVARAISTALMPAPIRSSLTSHSVAASRSRSSACSGGPASACSSRASASPRASCCWPASRAAVCPCSIARSRSPAADRSHPAASRGATWPRAAGRSSACSASSRACSRSSPRTERARPASASTSTCACSDASARSIASR